MNEELLKRAQQQYSLKEVDIKEYARLKGRGMTFNTRVFDAEDAGRLFLMDMKAMGGLMKMETATFTPVQLDAPILSVDVVLALGRSTLVLELYDTTFSHPDFSELDPIKARYAGLPAYDPGERQYYSMRLPQSDYKSGRKLKTQVETMADEYCEAYLKRLATCAPADPAAKKKENARLSKGLIESGGPAVNQFIKLIGEEKTREFLTKYMFFSE